MARENGSALCEVLRDLTSTPHWRIEVRHFSGGTAWTIAGPQWQAGIAVVPDRWLGMELAVREPGSEEFVSYGIDTDLYDIAQPAHQPFAAQIEADIISLLLNLRDNRVVSGYENGKFAVLIPKGETYLCVSRRRCWTLVNDITDADEKYAGFTPVN